MADVAETLSHLTPSPEPGMVHGMDSSTLHSGLLTHAHASDDPAEPATPGMVSHVHANQSQQPISGLLDTRQCAAATGMSLSSFQKLAAQRAWERGDLPVPVYVGRGSGKRDRWGRQGGMRRWRMADVDAWLESHKGVGP